MAAYRTMAMVGGLAARGNTSSDWLQLVDGSQPCSQCAPETEKWCPFVSALPGVREGNGEYRVDKVSLPWLWVELDVRKTDCSSITRNYPQSVCSHHHCYSHVSGKPPCTSCPLTLHTAYGNGAICPQKCTGDNTCAQVHAGVQHGDTNALCKNFPSWWGGEPETDCRRGVAGLGKGLCCWPVIKNKTRNILRETEFA